MLQLMSFAPLVTDARNHGALDSTNHVRAVVELFDHLHDGLNLLFCRLSFHHDDHEPLRPPAQLISRCDGWPPKLAADKIDYPALDRRVNMTVRTGARKR